jgi:hypothetical protein
MNRKQSTRCRARSLRRAACLQDTPKPGARGGRAQRGRKPRTIRRSPPHLFPDGGGYRERVGPRGSSRVAADRGGGMTAFRTTSQEAA